MSEIFSCTLSSPPHTTHTHTHTQILLGMLYKIYYMDDMVKQFSQYFNKHYSAAMSTDFNSLSLQEQVAYVKTLYKVNQICSVTITYSCCSIVVVFV